MYHPDQQPFGQLPTDEGTNERLIEMVQKEYIRFLHYREGESLRSIAKITGLHRNTVTKALADSEAPTYKRTAPIEYPVLGPFIPVINAWLEDDEKQPRKQRHTAKRIYERLCEPPYNFTGGESTVRDEVVNDFPQFLREHPGITAIGLNGRKAEAVFRREVLRPQLIPAADYRSIVALVESGARPQRVRSGGKVKRWREFFLG